MSTGPKEGLWVELTCDGNRRYISGPLSVNADDLSPDQLYECYKQGGEATKKIIEVCRDKAVGLIAPWTWSTTNWKRPQTHADGVFKVTEEFLVDLRQNWINLPENRDVRLVHMGRKRQLREKAPAMMSKLEEICDYTKMRTGMVVAMLMDYSGPDEHRRAKKKWKLQGAVGEYENCLDLPRVGVPYKEVDLRIRTGERTRIKHLNAVMRQYEGMETRDIFREEYLPEYTPEMFLADLEEFERTEKRKGK